MSIAEKLTYLQTTKQLLKTEINKINNVLDDNSTFRSYPQELFNGYLDILNNGTDTLWNNLEKVSASGEEATLENVETAPIKMVLNGNTSQDGTPTPDTPVEVKVVKGENVVSVQGKNEFNSFIATKINWQSGTISTENDGTLVISGNNQSNGYFQLGKKLSELCPNLKVGDRVYLHLETTGTRNNIYLLGSNYVWNRNTSITITQIMLNNVIAIYGGYKRTDTIKIMITKDVLATDYIPYSKTDYPINLGNLELCKIGNYQDYLYKNNGKWYVHKEIEKFVLDGSETWTQTPTQQSVYYITSITNYRLSNNIPMCNYFVGKANVPSPTGLVNLGNNNVAFISNTSAVRFYLHSSMFNSVSDLTTWLSTHNTIVYYILATPTETEITNSTLIEQLEAISKAKSVKDKTYITQTNDELPFILDVEAIKEYEVN